MCVYTLLYHVRGTVNTMGTADKKSKHISRHIFVASNRERETYSYRQDWAGGKNSIGGEHRAQEEIGGRESMHALN